MCEMCVDVCGGVILNFQFVREILLVETLATEDSISVIPS